ncbi:MAG TPA: hypothetical protein V6D11_07995 [Waterburya sp.]|jgi:hypothetical protein
MTTNYPIIETQLRLIRALQKGYAEALEAGDWQAADYRAAHLHKLCEGLHHLNKLLDKGRTIPEPMRPKTTGNWLSSIRAMKPTLSPTPALIPDDKSATPPSLLPELKPEQLQDEWQNGFQEPQPKVVDEAWQ